MTPDSRVGPTWTVGDVSVTSVIEIEQTWEWHWLLQDVAAEVEDETELLDAIEWVAPGIEIHNYKFWLGKPTLQELIASNGIHAALVVGNERVSPAEIDLDLEGVGLFRNGRLEASGIGAEIMGGPLNSLAWLANHLIRRGEHIRAGQLVIPGSAVELVPVEPGDRITAGFTRLGAVSATFASSPSPHGS
jgi:2-keto-4-pentenoate hydratase